MSQTLEEKLAAVTQRAKVAKVIISSDTSSSPEEMTQLKAALRKEQAQNKELWQQNCRKLAEFNASLTTKDEVIARLLAREHELTVSRSGGESDDRSHTAPSLPPPAERLETTPHGTGVSQQCHGRAPSLDAFTGEDLKSDWRTGSPVSKEWPTVSDVPSYLLCIS